MREKNMFFWRREIISDLFQSMYGTAEILIILKVGRIGSEQSLTYARQVSNYIHRMTIRV